MCIHESECAFINLIDDSKVYNALHPNVANISDADFVMEITPLMARGDSSGPTGMPTLNTINWSRIIQ